MPHFPMLIISKEAVFTVGKKHTPAPKIMQLVYAVLHAFITCDVKTGLSANAVLLQEHNLLNISLDVCGENGIVQHSRKAACLWNILRPITIALSMSYMDSSDTNTLTLIEHVCVALNASRSVAAFPQEHREKHIGLA